MDHNETSGQPRTTHIRGLGVLVIRSHTQRDLLTAGTTDSAQLRAKGVQAYGIGTFGGSGAHGNDERISVEGLGALVEFLYNAVVEVAATR